MICTHAAVAVALMVSGCEQEKTDRTEAPRPVYVVELSEMDPAAPLRLTGTVKPWAEEDVSFEVAGRVTYIVEPGTFLEGRWEEDGIAEIEGDILATLDRTPYEVAVKVAESQVEMARVNFEGTLPARLSEAQARHQQATKEYERNLLIRQQSPGAMSERELVNSEAERDATSAALKQAEAVVAGGEAQLRSAEANHDRAQLDLGNATLYAPFRGEVTDVLVQAGGYAEAGKPVAHLVTMDPIKIRVSVSAETNRDINRSDPVQLFIPDREDSITGNVYQKSTVANPATRTFGVTLICRNHKVWNTPSDEELARKFPRVSDLLPATRLDISGGGPLYVEERKTLGQDEQGHFVWIAEGINLNDPLRDPNGVLTIRKVRVVPGQTRVNYQGIFLARELADAGSLQFGQACVVGVPENAQDGDQVVLLPQSWLLRPGSLIEVEFTRDAGVTGLYVPVQAISPRDSQSGHVFVVQTATGTGAGEASSVATRVDVSLHETVGQLQRIEGTQSNDLGEGTQVIVQGMSYLNDGEPVNVVRIDEGTP